MLTLNDLFQGFRQPEVIRALAAQITELAKLLPEPLRVMEVCGGHTHTIMKYGLLQLLPASIEFVHGPGCPVCIMPKERIDQAIELASQPSVILVTLGDMIRVPGSKGTLAQQRAKGSDIRPVYDPLDALRIARENPEKTVVFFAIGFETSTPMTAAFPKGALWAKPEAIAHGILGAIDRRCDEVYLPGFWRLIMVVIRHIPERIFKKLFVMLQVNVAFLLNLKLQHLSLHLFKLQLEYPILDF